MVKSRPDGEPLLLGVARGTRVMQRHEEALVELCRRGEAGLGADDDDADRCVDAFLRSTYRDDDFLGPARRAGFVVSGDGAGSDGDFDGAFPNGSGVDSASESAEEEADCLVDSLYSMWAGDLPQRPSGASPATAGGGDGGSSPKKAVKPWSSRSSPSGTFVRDPATGKLRNLDD
jgi:hypothetical protein